MMDTFTSCDLAAFFRGMQGFCFGAAFVCFITGYPGWGAIACVLNSVFRLAYQVTEHSAIQIQKYQEEIPNPAT